MIENLTWFMIGFAAAGALFALFYDWSLRVVTAKWQEVTERNRQIFEETLRKGMDRAYERGLEDGLLRHGLKTTPANEPTGRSEGVRATPIAQT